MTIYTAIAFFFIGVLLMAVWEMNRDLKKLRRIVDNIARDVAALRSRSL